MVEIIVVDDEPKQRSILNTILTKEGYNVYEASNGKEALNIIKQRNPEIVLTDLKMPDMDGIQLLKGIKDLKITPEPMVLLMTAYGSIASAVEAIKNGAFDYLTKPLDKETLLIKLKQAIEKQQLLQENIKLKNTLYQKFKIDGIIGVSEKIKSVIEKVKKVAPTTATVLILGESGTGKELIAKAIHYNSPRRDRPFTAINCASIPESLLESELFGYEPGAFTGANTRKRGLFEVTNTGTIFLDEIGDMPLYLQAKLLRVLQNGEIRRLGGKDIIKVDIRVIAATNRDLEKLIENGFFREDLYYRLKVVTLKLPPLRERKEDIPILSNYFLKKYNEEFGKRIKGLDKKVLEAFIKYHWPGNIRQLESVIEKAVILSEEEIIKYEDVEEELIIKNKENIINNIEIPDEGIVFEELEKELMKKAMQKANNVVKKAAQLLGMSYKTFWYRWEKFGLGKEKNKS